MFSSMDGSTSSEKSSGTRNSLEDGGRTSPQDATTNGQSRSGKPSTSRSKSPLVHWFQFRNYILHNETDRELIIYVTTGDRKGAGTDANVWIIIYDEEGRATDRIKLGHTFRNDHERGSTCKFLACSGNGFGKPCKVEFWRDSFGFGHNWFLERIEVEDTVHSTRHIFPVHRWIRPERHYILREYDCCLPQDEEHQDQRRLELKEFRRTYQYSMKIGEGGPVQIKTLPEDEQFTQDYKWDIVKSKGRFILDTKLIQWTTDKWESICDLKKMYKFSLGEPHSMECWNEDRYFGHQRVQGVNPMLITLCKKIPDNFGVEPEMVEPFLEGLKLEEAIKLNKIFYTNVKLVEDVVCRDNRQLCCPLALFFHNKNNELMPIAIQLTQEKGPGNPVFLPSDPPNTWLLAKMYYNNADCSFHQSCTHLGFTHLLMEGVAICTHRNLSPSHPLFKLMAPHFLFLIAINTRGLDKLISINGWVDRTMTIGRCGMFELLKRGVKMYRLNVHGIVPNEIKSRGVDSPDILPHYPYRDDAVRLYNIIRRYVSKIVHHFYDTEDKILNDYELQQWRSELVKDRNLGGVGLQGVPGDENNRFTKAEEIVDVITVVISSCSLGHAAGNFQQYDEYAFPPNYPSILHGDWPRDKSPMTDKDILDRLPNKETTLDIMIITRLLSTKATQSLGDFESQYMFDPFCEQAAQEFRDELAEMSKDVKVRNRSKAFPYHWLDPEFIPNAISI